MPERTLERCLFDLDQGRAGGALSIDILMALLKIGTEDAAKWMSAFGDPLLDWKASALLGTSLGINSEVVRRTCEAHHKGEPLARAMTRLIIEAVLVFDRENSE